MLHLRSYLTIAVLLCFFSAFSPGCSNPKDNADRIKFRQYYIKGEQLYLTHCSNCHQKDGSGLGLLYPPLNNSDFMKENLTRSICLIKHGISGELIVNGKIYNKEMPALKHLSDLEIAEISTYIFNTWDHSRGLIDIKTVSAALQGCASVP